MKINDLVLESFTDFQPFNINIETSQGAKTLANMHIRPTPEWELYPQKPSVLFNADGTRRYGENE